jgi:hypothetical protein
MSNINGAWSETALVAATKVGGAAIEFQAITETIDIDIGEKGFDAIATLSGARVIKFTPQEPTTITMEMYAPEAGTDTGTTGKGAFDLLNTVDASQPAVIPVDRVRNKYRLAIMWTDASSITAEGQVVAPTNQCLRVVAADGYFTSVKPSFTDGLLKFTVTYKVAPFDSAGSANIKIESVAGSATATLTALASYTSTVKF